MRGLGLGAVISLGVLGSSSAALAHNVSSQPDELASVVDSQAIFAYLALGDVDWFAFEVSAADVATGPVLVSASALPPGCLEYQNVYPVTALIGPQAPSLFGPPGLPAPPPGLDVPFSVPAGLGIVVANNPRIPHPDKREIFALEEGDLGDIS